jgi:hypothetical protein
VVFADLVNYPADSLTDFQRLVSVHIQQVSNALHQDLGKSWFFRTFSNGAESDERGISILPILVEDILRHERNDWLDDVVS